MNLAQKLYYFRTKCGLNQAELAKRANLSQGAIAHYEAGRSTPTKNNLIQLAKVLGVELEVLTDDTRSVK